MWCNAAQNSQFDVTSFLGVHFGKSVETEYKKTSHFYQLVNVTAFIYINKLNLCI